MSDRIYEIRLVESQTKTTVRVTTLADDGSVAGSYEITFYGPKRAREFLRNIEKRIYGNDEC